MTKNWSYGVIAKFRSQFVNGYKSRTEQEEADLKSKFMTPAYLDISLGITYKSPEKKFPITVNMSPLALNATFAENDWIRKRQVDKDGNEIKPAYPYGIEDPDRTSKYEGGSSVQIDFDRRSAKRVICVTARCSTDSTAGSLTSARGTRSAITVSIWRLSRSGMRETRISRTNPACRSILSSVGRIPSTLRQQNSLSTTLSFELYYNRAQNVDVQTKTLLSVGLTYTFKNK